MLLANIIAEKEFVARIEPGYEASGRGCVKALLSYYKRAYEHESTFFLREIAWV